MPDRPPVHRRLAAALGRVDAALLRVRDSMTPGQRWTAALALVLVICVLAFGLPRRVVEVPAAAAPTSAAPVVIAPEPTPEAPLPGPGIPSGTISLPPALIKAAASPHPTPPPVTDGVVGSGPAGPPRVAALTAPSSGVPDRDDTAMAQAYLAGTPYRAHVIPDSGTPAAVCNRVVSSRVRVALSAHPLSRPLEQCLMRAAITVISPSPRGTRRPATAGAVSIGVRRGDVASVGDLARWGMRTRALAGKVGLVLDGDRRADLARAPTVVRRAGVDVRAVAYLRSDASQDAVLRAVSAFVGDGVGTVVFAVPVALQRTWVAQSAVLRAAFGYVVSDVDDGVTNEQYPPTFDGATAYTSLRVPWYARDHSETTAQRRCAATWTSAATPPTMLPGEDVAAYTWCEEVDLLDAAVALTTLTGGLVPALLHLRTPSPLTSTLGPLRHGGWGPTADAALVWRATCECWQEQAAYRVRSDAARRSTVQGWPRAV